MERLKSISDDRVQKSNLGFKRLLYQKISLKKRITGICGSSGTGKTHLLLQLMGNKLEKGRNAIYINMNDMHFSRQSLLEFASEFYRRGGEALFIDDLHKYRGAAEEMEEISVNLTGMLIVFTASFLPWEGDDLYSFPKEMDLYRLPGMSFREFLELKYDLAFPVIKIDELLELNRNPGVNVLSRIRPLQFFDEYLRSGYYVCQKDTLSSFMAAINEVVSVMLEGDLSSCCRVDYDSVLKIRNLLARISSGGPIRPNIEKLARETGTTRDSLLKFLRYTNGLGLTRCIYKRGRQGERKAKPVKIFMGNSNLVAAFNESNVSPGFLYETFIINQLSLNHGIVLDDTDDSIISLDGEHRLKLDWINDSITKRGLYDYNIAPGLDYQRGSIIPLWMFGFLY